MDVFANIRVYEMCGEGHESVDDDWRDHDG